MDTKDRFEEAKQIADAATEKYQSTVEALIILEIAVMVCKTVLDEGYYAKHPDERPEAEKDTVDNESHGTFETEVGG